MTTRPVTDLNYNENTIKSELQYQSDSVLFTQEDVTKNPKKWVEYKQFSKNL